MTALVTGAAGFIGSTLVDALLGAGQQVRAVDCFSPYYDETAKRRNLEQALSSESFSLVEADLTTTDLEELLDGVDVVYHQAGQPGVRLSWSAGFPDYVRLNVLATQRLLEACRDAAVRRFVYASSSSIYGNAASYPTSETDVPRPFSPYGVTKLAGEHLCSLYAENWGVPTVSLRYFTVYGPRQRPDMAMHRFIEHALDGTPLQVFGTGEQVRDFTFVQDVVAANIAAGAGDVPPGTVVNVCGGGSISVNDMLQTLQAAVGHEIAIERLPTQAGDVLATGGTHARATEVLGWSPQADLHSGLAAQVEWHRRRRQAG